MNESIIIRRAGPEDSDFLQENASLLVAFGPPAWHDQETMIAIDREVLAKTLDNKEAAKELFIAEDERSHVRLGFIHLSAQDDYYIKDLHAHIADVVVIEAARGRGIGKQLMQFAEFWARAKGYPVITLSVFRQNSYALRLYQQMGYGEDYMKMVKRLDTP